MSAELQKQLIEQSKMIANLTETVSRFVAFSIENTPRNNPFSLDKNSEKCYNNLTQNEGGSSKKGQFAKNSKELDKEEQEFMRTQKNVRLRKDGRFEWQKMIAGVWHREIDKDYRSLKRKIAEHERELKNILKHTRFASRLKKEYPILFDLCKKSVETSCGFADNLKGVLRKHISKLDKPIDEYTKSDIIKFLNELPIQPKNPFYILKKTYAEAVEEGIIERNPIATLKCPTFSKVKGRWFKIEEQKIIHSKKHDSEMADEIDFYLMTGCRANEAPNCEPDFDNNRVWVNRNKTDGTSGYVKISQAYCDILRTKWHTMFKRGDGFKYGVIFRDFLIKIGLKIKGISLHSLRHTFCSNLFYLGASDKYRQHAMGHKDSRMTSERYTTYDPNITKQEVLDIYGNLYPKFSD
ncbi:MAG: tyrosine-type recombinase/integrase [Firmicutes bacterium]|nr:tyrosine-type recombinase/integrase [Bacillota bacterium]